MLIPRNEVEYAIGADGVELRPQPAELGAVRGGLVVLLLSYLALWVDALSVTGAEPILPSVDNSTAAILTERVVEAGVEAALGDDGVGGRVVARIASRPRAALADVFALLEDPHILAVQQDRLFWAHVEAGSVDAALNQGSFWNLSHDRELRRRLGLVLEAGQLPLIQHGGKGQHFERDPTAKRNLFGFIDHAHPAAADLA